LVVNDNVLALLGDKTIKIYSRPQLAYVPPPKIIDADAASVSSADGGGGGCSKPAREKWLSKKEKGALAEAQAAAEAAAKAAAKAQEELELASVASSKVKVQKYNIFTLTGKVNITVAGFSAMSAFGATMALKRPTLLRLAGKDKLMLGFDDGSVRIIYCPAILDPTTVPRPPPPVVVAPKVLGNGVYVALAKPVVAGASNGAGGAAAAPASTSATAAGTGTAAAATTAPTATTAAASISEETADNSKNPSAGGGKKLRERGSRLGKAGKAKGEGQQDQDKEKESANESETDREEKGKDKDKGADKAKLKLPTATATTTLPPAPYVSPAAGTMSAVLCEFKAHVVPEGGASGTQGGIAEDGISSLTGGDFTAVGGTGTRELRLGSAGVGVGEGSLERGSCLDDFSDSDLEDEAERVNTADTAASDAAAAAGTGPGSAVPRLRRQFKREKECMLGVRAVFCCPWVTCSGGPGLGYQLELLTVGSDCRIAHWGVRFKTGQADVTLVPNYPNYSRGGGGIGGVGAGGSSVLNLDGTRSEEDLLQQPPLLASAQSSLVFDSENSMLPMDVDLLGVGVFFYCAAFTLPLI
jgi:hypothetical protein